MGLAQAEAPLLAAVEHRWVGAGTPTQAAWQQQRPGCVQGAVHAHGVLPGMCRQLSDSEIR